MLTQVYKLLINPVHIVTVFLIIHLKYVPLNNEDSDDEPEALNSNSVECISNDTTPSSPLSSSLTLNEQANISKWKAHQIVLFENEKGNRCIAKALSWAGKPTGKYRNFMSRHQSSINLDNHVQDEKASRNTASKSDIVHVKSEQVFKDTKQN